MMARLREILDIALRRHPAFNRTVPAVFDESTGQWRAIVPNPQRTAPGEQQCP